MDQSAGQAMSSLAGALGTMRLDSGKALGLDHTDMGRQMTPYVVRQGDYLLKLANIFGFDPDEVWNHPKNDEIRSLRKDHNILAPGDVIYLPERQREGLPIVKGALNRYQATVPKTYVNLRFQAEDEPVAGVHFVVRGGATPAEGTSDEEGRVKLMVPIHVSEIDVSFPERGLSYRVRVGHLDPIELPSGVAARLTHLGYLPSTENNGIDPEIFALIPGWESSEARLQRAVEAFQRDQCLPETGTVDDATRAAIRKAHGI